MMNTNPLAHLQEILEIHKDKPAEAKQRLWNLLRNIKASDSIEMSCFYLPGDCELSVRVREAARFLSSENIQRAIDAVAGELSAEERIEALATIDFLPSNCDSKT